MQKIRIYTDEDIAAAVSKALSLREYDAFTTIEKIWKIDSYI